MQILPVKHLGNLIGKSQLTEESAPDADEPGKDTSVKFNHPFLPPSNYTTLVSFASETKALAYIHFSEQIPFNHSAEVVSPPPDSVC